MATQTGSYDFKAAKAAHDEAAKTASDYITEITNDGIMVHAEGEGPDDTQTPTGWHISNVLEFIRQGVSRFWIGLKNSGDATPTVRIGKDSGESRMELDYHSMQMIDKEGNTYFHVSDLRDNTTGTATITDTFVGDGTKKVFQLTLAADSITSVVDSSNPGNTGTYDSSFWRYTFASAPADGASVTIVYKTSSVEAKAYSLSIRGNGRIGAMSTAEGYRPVASGQYSHAEGENCTASGQGAHAEGNNTEASAMWAHAEGQSTVASAHRAHAEGSATVASGQVAHAEGSHTTASGNYSHSEGYYTVASGAGAHALGYHTIAAAQYQIALGQYNVADDLPISAVILGNGSSESNRSNALTVGWNGNIDTVGTIDAAGAISSGSTLRFNYSGSNRCALNRSGDYLYITASDANGDGVGAYRFNMTTWGIAYRSYENDAWGSWETHIWNSAASRTKNTVLAAPSTANGAATFRALVPADCSWLGDREADDQSDNVSVANTTWVAIASVELAAGVWVLNGNVTFASNATGRRYACIHSASPTTAAQRQCATNANATSGAQTVLNLAGSKTPGSTTTYTLYAYQTSGSALNCTGYIAAMRIK